MLRLDAKEPNNTDKQHVIHTLVNMATEGGSKLRYCHIPYLTSNLSSPTPTFRTYLRPLLRRYLYFTSSYPFVAMQPPLLFLSISTSFYCSLFSYCPLLSSLPTCILTCNIRPLLSLLSMT